MPKCFNANAMKYQEIYVSISPPLYFNTQMSNKQRHRRFFDRDDFFLLPFRCNSTGCSSERGQNLHAAMQSTEVGKRQRVALETSHQETRGQLHENGQTSSSPRTT